MFPKTTQPSLTSPSFTQNNLFSEIYSSKKSLSDANVVAKLDAYFSKLSFLLHKR